VDRLLVGIDAGTSATRAAAFAPDGTLVAEAAVPVELSHPAPGWAEQPADILEDSACDALRALGHQVEPAAVGAIGITGQMGGLVLVDADGRPVSPHLSWLDGRASASIDQAMANDGRRLLALGGLTPYLAPKAAWWARERPDSFAQARRMVMAAGYVALRLAGDDAGAATVDRSSSGFVGLYDARTGDVEPALCELWGVDAALAPAVVPAGTVIGRLGRESASSTGLREGIPLVAAPGDGPCGWLGVGAVDPGVTVDTSGTSDHIGICGAAFAPDLEGHVLICLASGIEGLWHVQGYTAGTGLTHRWYLDAFPLEGGLEEVDRRASQLPPGSENLVCIPHFGGRVCPYEPAVTGSWVGLTWRHRHEHLYRSILESVAYEYACYLEAARRLDSGYVPTEVRVIGGGAASGLWTQIKADVLGLPCVVMEESSYTCWGAALSAGVGTGVLADMAASARAAARVRTVVDPDPVATDHYRGLVDVYKGLYPSLDPAFRALWERRGTSGHPV
jgi:xylulokinase